MNKTKTELIKQVCTGDWKSIPFSIGLKWLDDFQFTQIFVEAGKQIAGFERDGTEESELRRIVFCEKNMRLLAKNMRSVDDFKWFKILDDCIKNIVNASAMSDSNKQICRQRFCNIIGQKCRENLPKIYERSKIETIGDDISLINDRVACIELTLQKMLNEGKKHVIEDRQRLRQESEKEKEQKDNLDRQQKIEWNLSSTQVEGLFGPKENRCNDICILTKIWNKERKAYPGWYILPYYVCTELASKTNDEGLLQSHTFVDLDTMFRFSYELVWRYEKCMHLYSEYEIHHLLIIWKLYEKKVQDWNGTYDNVSKVCLEKWFYIGQVLLRIFREESRNDIWKEVYKKLQHYVKYGVNGVIDLQLEKAKQAYHKLDIPAMRIALAHCKTKKENYEQRLQILGLQTELDELDRVILELNKLMQDIDEAIQTKVGNCLYYASLRAGALQLYMLCVQGKWDYSKKYEIHFEEIRDIQNEIDRNRDVFDWKTWKNNVEHALLYWHARKYAHQEAFQLNREYQTIVHNNFTECEPAYRFFRMLDKLALPLKCGYVTLLGDMEQPWMEAIMGQSESLGLFLLCRGHEKKTIETLVDRRYLCEQETNEIGVKCIFLLQAISKNLEEIMEQERPMAGGILTQIWKNVPELLMRFMSRFPENQQEEALLLLKQIMEMPDLPDLFPISELHEGIIRNISETKKAQMLDSMLRTKIIEHKTLNGHADGQDIFSFYFRKTDIGLLQEQCIVRPETISWLLEIPAEAGYEWRTKVIRLETLYRLQLLNSEQQQKFAELLWRYVAADTGLPDTKDLYVFAYEKLPYIDALIPARSVKYWFLSRSMQTQIDDKDGCAWTMGRIPYLEELKQLCNNMQPGYWNQEEVEQLLNDMLEYGKFLIEGMIQNRSDSLVCEEYRNRAQQIEKTAAALCRNTMPQSSEMFSQWKQMLVEMQQQGISVRELEVQIAGNDNLVEQICNEMRSFDEKLVEGEQIAAHRYILAHSDTQQAQYLLEELLKHLRYHMKPGLVSAIFMIHNLCYAKSPIVKKKRNQDSIDECLMILADVTQTQLTYGMKMKEILRTRQACMALAFQMYQMAEAAKGRGVQRWKAIAADEKEINEIRQEWMW